MADEAVDRSSEMAAWESTAHPFEIEIRDRIKEDYKNAKKFLEPMHRKMRDHLASCRNASQFTSLRKDNKFPVPYMQAKTDQAAADFTDKLFYADTPCTLVGREGTDKQDADAKQAMIRYQDEEDGIYLKFCRWVRDCIRCKMAVAQVDYVEETTIDWVQEDVPMYARDMFNQLVMGEDGMPSVVTDADGNPVMSGEKKWARREVPVYKGAKTKRVHPLNFFFTGDKEEPDDEFPVMVRSWQSKQYFYSKPYFFNQSLLGDGTGVDVDAQLVDQARQAADVDIDRRNSKRPFRYVEWQAMVPKAKLFEFLAAKHPEEFQELDAGRLYLRLPEGPSGEPEVVEIRPNEWCWAIAGLVNDEVLVRLDESSFDTHNVVWGFIQTEDDGQTGIAISDLIEAVHKGFEDLVGMLLTSFKQSIDAFWIINENAVTKKGQLLNAAGKAFFTNGNPRDVMHRVEQPNLANAVFLVLQLFDQFGKDASGISSIVEGKGDRAAETLGESTQALMQGMLRMRDYLKTFEKSFVIPLYTKRNQVNAAMIDSEYAYRVVGQKAKEWRTIEPHTIRAQVDFICESSTRETQRAVLIGQILQLSKTAPLSLSAGQPVRLDKLAAELAEVGFSWSQDKIKEIWPLIALEESMGVEKINQMLAENAMMLQMVQRMQMMMAAGGGMFGQGGVPGQGGAQSGVQPAAPGGPMPQPQSEGEAVQGAMFGNGRIAI